MSADARKVRSGRLVGIPDAMLATPSTLKKLALPTVHDRETRKLIDIVTRDHVPTADLRAYAQGRKPVFVYAVIQSVARRLGERWVSDDMNFERLSTATAVLHDLLRIASDDIRSAPDAPAFAILLQNYDDHILTGSLLEARLRTAGFGTDFRPGWNGEPLEGFAGVFLCASNSDRAGEIEDQIARIKAQTPPETPIILGGAGALQSSAGGADLVTSSPDEAVDFCLSSGAGHRG